MNYQKSWKPMPSYCLATDAPIMGAPPPFYFQIEKPAPFCDIAKFQPPPFKKGGLWG